LGDSSSLPNSKTAAAIFAQTPLLVNNILHVWRDKLSNETLPGAYNGYSGCPIFVGDKKLMMAEFKYDNVVDQTFFNNQEKPRRIFYYLKKSFFPFAYWNLMPRGLWYGQKHITPNFFDWK